MLIAMLRCLESGGGWPTAADAWYIGLPLLSILVCLSLGYSSFLPFSLISFLFLLP